MLTKGRATCSVSNEHLPPADNSWNRVEKEREDFALQGALGFRCKIRLGGIRFDGFFCAPKQGVPSCPSQFWFQVCSARSMFGVLGSKKRCGRVQPGWDVPGVCEQKEGATKHWRRVSAFGFLFSTIATLKSRCVDEEGGDTAPAHSVCIHSSTRVKEILHASSNVRTAVLALSSDRLLPILATLGR